MMNEKLSVDDRRKKIIKSRTTVYDCDTISQKYKQKTLMPNLLKVYKVQGKGCILIKYWFCIKLWTIKKNGIL